MMALPWLQFFIFYICVNFNSILLAFKSYSISEGEQFAGLANFAQVFSDMFHSSEIIEAFKNSLLLWVFSFLVGMTLALFFSYYIYKKYLGSGLFRIVLFLPSIISSIVLVIMFRYFVTNALPAIMEPLGVVVPDLLDMPAQSKPTIIFYCLWTGFGTSTMMYVGAMNNISDSIVEYAQLDGFSPLQEFFYITLPMIFPTIITFVTVGIAGILTNQMGLYNFYGPAFLASSPARKRENRSAPNTAQVFVFFLSRPRFFGGSP